MDDFLDDHLIEKLDAVELYYMQVYFFLFILSYFELIEKLDFFLGGSAPEKVSSFLHDRIGKTSKTNNRVKKRKFKF